MKLKLNVKRTFYIGFAFFTILMLWQVYNTYCPLFLSDLFIRRYGGTADDYAYIIGIVMALDNILALFMLPLFGAWSDRTKSKLGKRMPFIIAGSAMAVILFPLIAILFIYQQIIWLIIVMGLVLVAMNIYRSPAVALMPDITPKPLRSRANAIVNLVGYIGAISAGALAMLFKVENVNGLITYNPSTVWIPFVLTALLMIVAILILVFKIKENKLAIELKPEMDAGENASQTEEKIVEDKKLGKTDKTNLILLLASIFLWFFAFNAIETFGSSFGVYYLGVGTGWWGTAVIIMTISSIIAFIPAGIIANKIGRKYSVLLGLGLMLVGVIVCSVIKNPYVFYPFIAIAGVGWAWINVNSYPMVVELASSKNVGKFTGWYYTASMLAQSITPICIGFVFKALGFKYLFIYVAVFTVLSITVFSFYKTPKKQTIKSENSQKDIKQIKK